MNGSLSVIAREAGKYFGLSRMSHSVLDVPYLAVGALLALEGPPSGRTIALGLLAAFAGITAIFGLNDLLDRRVDARAMAAASPAASSAASSAAAGPFDMDSLGFRHPLAQGKLSFGASLAWVAAWGAVSLLCSFLVRPACALLLLAAAGFEFVYCALVRVTPAKTIFTGLNVAVGGLAAPFAVSSAPSPLLLLLFFLWSFAWEVGCRNIPNDWTDSEDDAVMHISTIPLLLGRRAGARISFAVMAGTVLFSLLFPLAAPMRLWPLYEAGALGAAGFFLVGPAVAWQRALDRRSAQAFFNRACLYPLSLFVVMAALAVI